MAKKTQPTQQTPKGHEIPVRSKTETLRDFAKIVRPKAGESKSKKTKKKG